MRKICILLLTSILISCVNSQKKTSILINQDNQADYKHLLNVKKFQINNNKWYLVEKTLQGLDEFLFVYNCETEDTLKSLILITKNDTLVDESMSIDIIQDSIIKRIELEAENKTLWVYTQHKDSIKGQKIFLYGKYLYDYINLNYSWGQRLYYEKFQDSLRHIRGNNLPPLPALEYEEKPFLFKEERID